MTEKLSTETRSTQYPFSSLWNVTRSTTPSIFAVGTPHANSHSQKIGNHFRLA